jgi:hypothetical protein
MFHSRAACGFIHRLRSCSIVWLTVLGLACSVAAGAAEPVARFPFEIQANRIIFPMKIGDSSELMILLDTGLTFEGVYLFHEEKIEELGLTDGVEEDVAGAGADDPSSSVLKEGATLNVGGIEFQDQRIYVSRSPRTQSFPRDGVAGWTLLGNYVVEIDHNTMTIALYDKSSFEPDPSWDPIEMTLRHNIPWIDLGISVGGEEETPAEVYIDLGAGDALLLLVRPEMKFPMPEGMESKYIGTGLSGDIYGDVGKVASVRIGSHRLKNVVTAFPDAEVRSKQEGADGIVGSDLLRRFNVIFDYDRSRIYLKPNRAFEERFE